MRILKFFIIVVFLGYIAVIYPKNEANPFRIYKKEIKDILQKLQHDQSLEGKKIYVHSWKKSSDYDTPPLDVQPWDKRKKGTWGSGDEFMFKPLIYDKLTSLGADVAVAVPAYLLPFFKQCSPLQDRVYGFGIDDHTLLQKGYIPIEGRDVLDNIRSIETFEVKTKYFGPGCYESVLQEVAKVRERCLQLLKNGIVPILFNRVSARLNEKFSQNIRDYKRYHYLKYRVISYEDYLDLLKRVPENIRLYNVTFDDRNIAPEIRAGDPTELYSDYREKRASFINDGILTAGVLTAVAQLKNGKKIAGHIMSVETGLICMGMECHGLHEDNENIHLLLTEIYNNRWNSLYRRENGNLCWGPINLMIQKKFGQWSDIKEKILQKCQELSTLAKQVSLSDD